MTRQLSKIIQIVPQLSPAINGLGDYGLNLARQLRQHFNMETHFVVGDRNWIGATEIEGFSISKVTEHSAANLHLILTNQPSTILLHYVGYGYAKRGCPSWLVDGLQRWRTANSHRRLLTFFHEIYASSDKFWNSSFWLSSLQKNLAVRLVRLSDRVFTSKQLYAEMLYKFSRGKHPQIPTLPVFSNIGEPEQVSPLSKRPRRLVVFGSRYSKLQVYQQSHQALERVCQDLEIEEIYDIGVSTGLKLPKIQDVPIVEMGVITATEASSILLNSIAGFLKFPPPDFLAKSTIFAAYCAHGLVPILTFPSTAPTDGLEVGKHYWVVGESSQPISQDVAQAIANNAYAWYQAHSLPVQAKIFASHLEKRA